MPGILALDRPRPEDYHEFKANVGFKIKLGFQVGMREEGEE